MRFLDLGITDASEAEDRCDGYFPGWRVVCMAPFKA